MVILSINFNHDGSAVVLHDGQITGYVNTERFSRIKKFPGVRQGDLDNLFDQAQLTIGDVDLVILQNYGFNYPEIVERYKTDFQDTWPPLYLNERGDAVSIMGREIPCRMDLDHFLCHSAVAYFFSPFESAVCFSYDPMGSGAYVCTGNTMRCMEFPVSLAGDLYNLVSLYKLMFGGVFGAGKTMGLAPYGRLEDPTVLNELVSMCKEGVTEQNIGRILALIDALAERHPRMVTDQCSEWNASYAFFVQEALEIALDDCLDKLYERFVSGDISPNLCLGGGTALNSVANQKCFSRSRFGNVYMHPACGDDGTAIGAALYLWHHELGHPKIPRTNTQAMYSIRTYEGEILDTLRRFGTMINFRKTGNYIEETAELIARGKIIGWFQGASEIGPRALGNRSIVCDPRSPGMKDTLNSRVKHREAFRPFAPTVLNEFAEEWFGLRDSPFMLRVAEVLRPGVPAITHQDGSARIQTICREDNPNYYRLVNEFFKRSGVPMVVNTSFNVRGDPIVETPHDAIKCLLDTDIDYLVFPNYIVDKVV